MANKKHTSDTIDNFHEWGLYPPTRTVQFPYLGDEDCDINQSSVNMVMANLHILESMDNTQPITLLLNSYGGDVFQSLGLYDFIRSLQSEVYIQTIGACMSGATLILQAGDKRIISENCTFMMHIGESSYSDHSHNVRNWVDYEKSVVEPKMREIYASRLKRKARESDRQLNKRIDKLLERDTILNADKVIELGLADEVLSVKEYISKYEY